MATSSPWRYVIPLSIAIAAGILIASAVVFAFMAYGTQQIAEHDQKALEQLKQQTQSSLRKLQQKNIANARTRKAEAQAKRDRLTPYYPKATLSLPVGERGCLNGQTLVRESNGWTQVHDGQGNIKRCRDHR